MFAIALWDKASRKLVLARDRMGEKPLYYGYSGAALVFASELKGLMPIPGFGRNLNRNALASFMRHNYIPAPQSIYEGIAKLPPPYDGYEQAIILSFFIARGSETIFFRQRPPGGDGDGESDVDAHDREARLSLSYYAEKLKGPGLAAVYVHGLAADHVAARRGEDGMVAGDVVHALPEAIRCVHA